MLKIKEQYLEGIIVSLVGFLIFIFALQIPNNPMRLPAGTMNVVRVLSEARSIPAALGLILIFFGIKIARSKAEEPKYIEFGKMFSFIKGNTRIIVTIGTTSAYIFFLGRIHFYIATFLYLFTLYIYFQFKKINSVFQFIKILAIAFIATFFSAGVIPFALNMMRLP